MPAQKPWCYWDQALSTHQGPYGRIFFVRKRKKQEIPAQNKHFCLRINIIAHFLPMLQALKSKEMHKLCNSSDRDLWARDQHRTMESASLEKLSRIRVQPVTEPYLLNQPRARECNVQLFPENLRGFGTEQFQSLTTFSIEKSS